MRIARAAALLLMLAPLVLAGYLVQAQSGSAEESEGWYTEAQAERGNESYLEHCAKCHPRDLSRGFISLYRYPALSGAYFLDRWEGENVRTLFQVIKHTMPLDAPGTLDSETYADIVARILQANNFPAGNRELPTERADPDRLRGLIIEQAAMVEQPQPQEPAPVELEQVEEEPEPEAEPAGSEPEEPPGEPGEQFEDEWYSEAQALRGQDEFMDHCAKCHGRALQGVGVAPSLAGANFIARWEGERVSELFRIASTLMPLDGPAELEPQTYADLVAFILWENGFPSGDRELPPDFDQLQRYTITPELAEVPEVP